jgi:Mrr N-terminal domain
MPRIDVSDRTYQRLLQRADSFEDSPDSVIERALDEIEALTLRTDSQRPRSPRRPEGDLLPETEYWHPILQLLDEAGGRARGSEIIDALEPLVRDRLTAADKDTLSIGEVRWRNRARFARLRMKELGFISDQSPRGIWEITDTGRDYLASKGGVVA